MKNIFLVVTFTTIAKLCSAQSGSVSGKVLDKTGKALEAATVSLHRLPDSSLVTGSRTGLDGSYSFQNLKDGKFFLEARMIGYSRAKSKAFNIGGLISGTDSSSSSALMLAPLILTEKVRTIKGGVMVVAQRPFIERQADKLVVNVESSLVSSGSTALEVLQRTPGITLDKDDHIQLKGKAGATVMIDGKLTYLTGDQIANLLKNMASENISKIEVITNPSAKYDAAGNTGIVNIITKKGKKAGFNGNITASASKGILPKYNSNLSLNYKTSRFNFFADLGLSERKNVFRRYNYSIYKLNPLVGNELYEEDHNQGTHKQYKAGVDITLSKNNTLSFTLTGYNGLFNRNGAGTTNRYNRAPGMQDTILKNMNFEHEPYSNITYATNYKLTLDSLGQELSFDADYARFSDISTTTQVSTPFINPVTGTSLIQAGNITSLINHQPSFINIKTIKADYTLPVDSTIKLEAGTKASWVKAPSNYSYDSLANGVPTHPTRLNDFVYTERILAAYLSSTFKWQKFTLQAGLRAENTNSLGDLVTTSQATSRNYTDLFPNVALTEKFSDSHQLALSATRRINRPDYGNINPFIFYLDRNSYFKGNPDLKPQYTFQYELSYTFKQKYIATLSYANTRNNINEFARVDTVHHSTEYTVVNFNNQNSYNLTLSAPGDFTPLWTSTNSFSLNYNEYTNQYITGAGTKGFGTYNFNVIESFKIPGDWKAELNMFYNSKNFDGTYLFDPQYAIGAAVQKTFLNKKADLKLNVNDIFNTNHFYGKAVYNDVNILIRNKWESRRFTIAFTYRFGGAPTDSKKKNSSSDELNRAGGKG